MIEDKSTNIKDDNGELSKYCYVYEAFFDPEIHAEYPAREDFRKRLIKTLRAWGQRETSLVLLKFSQEYGLSRRTLVHWAQHDPEVREAYEEMKLMIVANRQHGCVEKKYDTFSAYRDMHTLDPEYHQVNKYHADMKKEEAHQPNTFNVIYMKPKVLNKEEVIESQKNE